MKKNLNFLIPAILLALNTGTMAQSETAGNLTGTGVVCPDLQKSMKFYLDVIGMTRTGGFDVDAGFAKSSGLTDGVPFHVEVLKLGESPDAISWKLMTFGKGTAPSRSEYVPDEAGMQYITLQVGNLGTVLGRCRDNGVQLLGESPVRMQGGDRYFALVRAPEGTFIELIGPMP